MSAQPTVPTYYHHVEFAAERAGHAYAETPSAVYVGCILIRMEYDEKVRSERQRAFIRRQYDALRAQEAMQQLPVQQEGGD